MAANRRRCKSDKLPPPVRPPRVLPDDGLAARIEAMTHEQLLDTSIEDARDAESAKFAEQLHAEGLARGDKEAIEEERLFRQTDQYIAERRRQPPETGSEK